MKEFVFLYPIPEYVDISIENSGGIERDGADIFRKKYNDAINEAIDIRYRKNGFGINYVLFDNHPVSDLFELQDSDRFIQAGLDFKTHTTKLPNGEYTYPNPDNILDKLTGLHILRVAGFHLNDCVEKIAQKAYERGLDVLVDEELTEIFPAIISDSNFKTDKYPSLNPRSYGEPMFQVFLEGRKNRPWLWQGF